MGIFLNSWILTTPNKVSSPRLALGQVGFGQRQRQRLWSLSDGVNRDLWSFTILSKVDNRWHLRRVMTLSRKHIAIRTFLPEVQKPINWDCPKSVCQNFTLCETHPIYSLTTTTFPSMLSRSPHH